MRRLETRTLGVEQGSLVLFSDYVDNGAMWTGTGAREIQREIRFSESFRDDPVVQVSMSMWDMDQSTNPRADLSFDRVSPDGFWIIFRTWGDTRIARVRADWTAMGPLKGPDEWELY
ncbi:H-type lectin domain-containing protein [Oceaniglobus ichthyenteri]|uniref:H-type lectin domain-containing protein n=1 Tax=Oceaniglobus ichthyenteri TaxID=2136177 RepID=UPI000D388416|nr:H-type lectin domain-containing protein [Oceaniglobus ichthyenteri]